MGSRRQLARGSVAAAFSTWVALTFHVLGGGDAPAPAGVVIPFVLSWCACVSVAGWRRDAPRLAASVLVSQGLFHLLFTLGATSGAAGGHHGSAIHLGGADVAGAAPWSHMWLAHLLAAGITIVGLHSGERALARLGRATVGLARRLCTVPARPRRVTPLAVPSSAPPHVTDVRPALGHFDRAISRRGPPVSLPSR